MPTLTLADQLRYVYAAGEMNLSSNPVRNGKRKPATWDRKKFDAAWQTLPEGLQGRFDEIIARDKDFAAIYQQDPIQARRDFITFRKNYLPDVAKNWERQQPGYRSTGGPAER